MQKHNGHNKKNNQQISHVPPPRHPIHHLPAACRLRQGLRVNTYCFLANLGRLGAGRYCRTNHIEQEITNYKN